MEGAGPADKLSPRHGPAEKRSQEYIKPAHPSDMSGPTPWSNWIVPQQVVAGGYPCCFEDIDNDRLLNMLLFELGIETFVCLQSEVVIDIPDDVWRSGKAPRPYIHDARRLLQEAKCNGKADKNAKVDFLQLAIPDGGVVADAAMINLAKDVCERIRRGERMYIHCWGGHGRTGTLVALVLGMLYEIPCSQALRYTQAYHDMRQCPQSMRSPATAAQRSQVVRILDQCVPNNVPQKAEPAAPSSKSEVEPEGLRRRPRPAPLHSESRLAVLSQKPSTTAGAYPARVVREGRRRDVFSAPCKPGEVVAPRAPDPAAQLGIVGSHLKPQAGVSAASRRIPLRGSKLGQGSDPTGAKEAEASSLLPPLQPASISTTRLGRREITHPDKRTQNQEGESRSSTEFNDKRIGKRSSVATSAAPRWVRMSTSVKAVPVVSSVEGLSRQPPIQVASSVR